MKKKSTFCIILSALFIGLYFCARASGLNPATDHKNYAGLQAATVTPICTGTSTTITGDSPAPVGTFRWEVLNAASTWVPAPGLNVGADYTTTTLFSNANAPRVYNFRRRIVAPSGTSYDSFNDVAVNPKTAIANNQVTAPATATFCVNGDPDIITGQQATGGDGVTYNYQWQQSINGGSTFTDIAGATSQNYDPSILNVTTIYQRVASSGACNPPSVSNKVTITILSALTNNFLFEPSTTFFCNRSIPTIINGSKPGGGTGTIQYQWQNSLDGVNFTNIPNNTTMGNDYNAPALTQTTYYRRLATSGVCTTPAYSNVITIVIQQGLSNNSIFAPAVTTLCTPGDADAITGSAATGGNGVYKYQWQSSPDGGLFTNIPGATSKDYDPPALTATWYYQRTVTSSACTTPLVSNQVMITIKTDLAATANTLTAPATTAFCTASNPGLIAGSVPVGGNGVFNYAWQKSVNGGAFTDIPNSNVQSFNPGTVSQTTTYRRGTTISTCNIPTYSNEVTIIIQTPITVNTITAPATTTFCTSGSPGPISGSIPAGGGNYVFVWQSSVNGGPFTDIPNSNVQNYDPQAVTQTTVFKRGVQSASCSTIYSNPVTITILTAITRNEIYNPATIFFCNRADNVLINGNIPIGGTTTFHYQWQSSVDGINFTDLAPSNTSPTDYGALQTSRTTYYRRVATSGPCTIPSYSNVIVITVQPGLSNNSIIAPAVTTFCSTGDADVIKGTSTTGGTGVYSYQWQSSPDGGRFTNIPGATNPDYDPPVLSVNQYYQRTVISGACTTPLTSNQVLITVTPALTSNTITAPATTTFCTSGSPGPISGSIPAGGGGNYVFVWQSSVNGGPFTDIPNSNVQNYDPQAVTQTTVFQRGVRSVSCSTIYSNPVTITITPQITSNVINQPVNAVYCGTSSPLTISTQQPTGGNGTYTYQWLSSTDNVNYTPISNASLANYAVPALNTTTWFKRLVSSGNCTVAAQSNAVSVTVNAIPANVVVTPVAPVCAGSITAISIVTPNPTLSYFWYDSPAKSNKLFTGTSYSVGPINATQTFYVEASNGSCTSAALTSATVTVNPLPPAPVLVNGHVSTCKGTAAVLEIANPQSAYTYKWFLTPLENTFLFSGTKFITPSVNSTVTYYVEAVDNSTGCISFTPRTAVTVLPIQMPVITAQGTTVCTGAPATLTTDNADVNVTVKWYTTPTGGTSVFTGNSYTITTVNANATYYAEASNGSCVSATRSVATVQVTQPLGTPVVSVESVVAPNITFSWAAVAGATGYQVSIDGGQTFIAPSSGVNGTTHMVTGLQDGQSVTIVVRATGDVDCQRSSNSIPVTGSISVNSDAAPIYIANAFTPNGDGKNDVVYVHHENIKSLKFYVYDQWGELLYVSQSQQNGWDGTFKGKTEPAGVYVYYLEAIMNNGQQVTKKGTITLLR